MTFVGIIDRPNTITIDGYSNAKTIKGAIADMGRHIKKNISESEGNGILENKEESLLPASQWDYKNGLDSYFFTIEEVPCAASLNEETDSMEYADGNFYMVVRICK